jgi:hypothetical protein
MDRRRDCWERHGLLRFRKEEAAKQEEAKEEEEEAGGGCRFRQKERKKERGRIPYTRVSAPKQEQQKAG